MLFSHFNRFGRLRRRQQVRTLRRFGLDRVELGTGLQQRWALRRLQRGLDQALHDDEGEHQGSHRPGIAARRVDQFRLLPQRHLSHRGLFGDKGGVDHVHRVPPVLAVAY